MHVFSVKAGSPLCEFVVNQHFVIRTNVSFSLKNYYGSRLVMCSFHAGVTRRELKSVPFSSII